MLLDINASSFARQLENLVLKNISQDLGNLITETLDALGFSYRERIFTPFVTLYAFLSQIFNDDSSCRRVVLEVAAIRKVNRQKRCSTSTGSFCKAKKRLPQVLIEKLVKRLACLLSEDDERPWRHGRVFVVDGTSFSMPDTAANASEFVRHGLGVGKGAKNKKTMQHPTFPEGRLSGIFSLQTGLLIDLAISTWKGKGTGETSLLQQLWSSFKKNDTLLGDAIYSSFIVIASAKRHGVHIVSELKTASYGRINKKRNDQIITITKPPYHSTCSLSKEDYASLSNEITVRIVKLVCAPAGFRPTVKFIITTHLEENIVTLSDLTELYRQRWQVELNFRSIKTHLGMDILTSKSPDMVKKEVWVHMLAYNLIRQQMIIAGHCKKIPVWTISFRAAQQALSIYRLLRACGVSLSEEELISQIISEEVGKRPNRYEPRTLKRRSKNYKLMTEPRSVAKTKLHKKSKN